MRQSVRRGYAAEAIGGLEYSPRRGCVANTAQYKCSRLKWNTVPLRFWPSWPEVGGGQRAAVFLPSFDVSPQDSGKLYALVH